MNTEIKKTADREIVITRLINAPRNLVWEAWTNPEHIKHWWGPDGFTNTIHEMEVKPGGIMRFMMHGPNGMDFPNKIVFKEVEKPSRLFYSHGSDDDNDPGMFETMVTFEEKNGKTLLTMRAIFASAEERDKVVKEHGALEGGNQTVTRLEAFLYTLSDDNAFIITRQFDAPRNIVFKVWTEAEHLKHWWGPKGFDIEVKKLDFRPGGIFHYCMKAASGQTMWGRFKYQEIVSPEKIVFVNSFSDEEGNIKPAPFGDIKFPLEVLNIFTFTEQDGKSILTLRAGPVNATEEEMAVYKNFHGSMQQGYGGTFEKLADYLSELFVS